LSEGRYRIWIDLGRDAGGRRRRYSEVVRGTKKDAERRERELRRSQDTRTFVDPRSGTVAEYLERWLRDYCEAAVTARTLHRYRQIVNMHLVPALGARKLADLLPLDIEEAKRYWLTEGSKRTKGKGLHPRTVHHHLAILHDALAQAVRWRLLVVNPCDAVAPVRSFVSSGERKQRCAWRSRSGRTTGSCSRMATAGRSITIGCAGRLNGFWQTRSCRS
jgi:integrase